MSEFMDIMARRLMEGRRRVNETSTTWEQMGDAWREVWRCDARFQLAGMLEPTEGMLEAVEDEALNLVKEIVGPGQPALHFIDKTEVRAVFARYWRAAITEALTT